MRPVALTVVLLALAIVLVAAVPSVREGLKDVAASTVGGASPPSRQALEKIALAHPNDATVWFGYAELTAGLDTWEAEAGWSCGPPAKTTAADAYAKAIEPDPRSAPIHFRAALYHLSRDGGRVKLEPSAGQPPGVTLTETEAKEFGTAQALLEECRGLDPSNAACDYLVAWALLTGRRQAEAFAVLRDALGKDNWSLYEGEAGQAALRVLDDARVAGPMRATYAWTTVGCSDGPAHSRLRDLARSLAELSKQFMYAGQHDQAIFCQTAIIHLGRLMRMHAHTMIEGLMGIAVTQIAAGPFLSEADRQRARTASAGDAASREQVVKLRTEGLTSYLRYHGRDRLADLYTQEVAAGETWRRDATRTTDRQMSAFVSGVAGGGVLNAGAAAMALIGMALIALVAGIASLAARSWRERKGLLQWHYSEWVLLLIVLVAPAQLAASVGTALAARGDGKAWSAVGLLLIVATLAGVIAWLVAVIAVALRKHARLSVTERPGKGRALLAGLRAFVPSTIAALILLSVAFLPLVHRNSERETRRQETIMTQGEVQYWGIGRAGR
jgi:tetratricopeptide (TPR) repeat protein